MKKHRLSRVDNWVSPEKIARTADNSTRRLDILGLHHLICECTAERRATGPHEHAASNLQTKRL